MAKKFFAITGVGLGFYVQGMTWSISNMALSPIQESLSADLLQLQWVINAFGLAISVPLLVMGKLGDFFGRKKLFLIGQSLMLIGLLLAGSAENIAILIASMAIIGLASSIILPLSQALLIHLYPEKQKEKAVGIWAVIAALSLASGPLVGGVILDFLEWQWVYWIGVPILLLSLPLVIFLIHNEKDRHKSPTNWLGILFLALTVFCAVTGFMQGPSWGWTSKGVLAFFGFAFLFICLFIFSEKRSKTPLFHTDFFLKPSFLLSTIPNALTIGIIWMIFFSLPLFMQNMLGISALSTGFIMLLITIPMAAFSTTVARLYTKTGPKPLMLIGMAVFILACLLLLYTGSTIWTISVGALCFGIGWVLIWGPSTSCALSSIPHSQAGIASGMFTTFQEVGAILIFTIGGVIFRSVHASVLAQGKSLIDQTFKGFSKLKIETLLSNPDFAEKHLGKTSPILPLLDEAFLQGFHRAFSFVLAIGAIAFIGALFLPRVISKGR